MKSDKTDICLVSPISRATSATVPIALLYLHSWLVFKGVVVKIIDVKCGHPGGGLTDFLRLKKRNEIISKIKQCQPAMVGIPCYTPEFWEVIEMCSQIREQFSGAIVIGGMHATLQPLDFLYEGSPVDYVIRGDGQIPLFNLFESIQAKSNTKHIEGLCNKETILEKLPEAAEFVQWEQMPVPDYSQINMEYYLQPHTNLIRNLMASGIHVMTTIGCPFSCTFCSNSNKKVKYRPIQNVIDELLMLRKKYAIDTFYILDDTFLLKKTRVEEFVSLLKDKRLDCAWAMETRVNLINDKLVEMIKNAGCIQIDFGVESGSEESLLRMKKGIKPNQIREAFRICHKFKLRTLANFMFNTPGESENDVNETIRMIMEIKPTVTGICLTVPFPGTAIYNEYIKPPLLKEEYKIYSTKYLYVTKVDSRFSMVKHNLDLIALRIRTTAKANGIRSLIDLTINRRYWGAVFHSKRKSAYFIAFTKGVGMLVVEKTRRIFRIMWRS